MRPPGYCCSTVSGDWRTDGFIVGVGYKF
ncbi:TPA: Ail/Lom family outer membrane beta-barrel protein [Escherichia coli]